MPKSEVDVRPDKPKLRFVLNAREPDTPAGMVCIRGLAKHLSALGHLAVINDWENYSQYDVAIFMAMDAELEVARQQNSKIIIGLGDPKPSTIKEAVAADFCIVSSIEQREAFTKFNRNIFVHYMIPEFDSATVTHRQKTVHKIFYHGNKVHLNSSFKGLVPALNELGKKHAIEFNVIYNIEELGRWRMGLPCPIQCPVRELQWYPNCYKDYLKDADVGVVQNLMPFRCEGIVRQIGMMSKGLFLEGALDHVCKFKSSTNAGRAFVFGYFGVPVVAEAVPSLCDAIVDCETGRLVLTAEGWYDALDDLITSPYERTRLAGNFSKDIKRRFTPEVSARRLVKYLNSFKQKDLVNLQNIRVEVWREVLLHTKHRVKRRFKKFESNKIVN